MRHFLNTFLLRCVVLASLSLPALAATLSCNVPDAYGCFEETLPDNSFTCLPPSLPVPACSTSNLLGTCTQRDGALKNFFYSHPVLDMASAAKQVCAQVSGIWADGNSSPTSYALTVSKSGNGSGTVASSTAGLNCGATCAANLPGGTSVTLTATPANGSTFAGWSGACTGTGQCIVTLTGAASVSAQFNPVPFVVSTHLQLTPTSASLDTRITFNSGDIGKTGAVFVTARVPSSALATLPMAPSSKIAAELTANADPSSMVTIQLTAAGWSIIENGQLLPYASGVLGDLLAAQKILDSADPRLMPGAQFCLGYGASALEMLNNDRLQLIATIPDGGTVFSGSCLDVDSRGQAIEFYHSALKHYFITIDPNEAAAIDAGAAGAGWTRTGGTFKVYPTQASGSQPVCRFYGSQNPGPNSHFFTVSADECAGLQAQQASTPETVKKWHYENIAFYIFTPINAGCTGGSTPVYRYYNNGFAHGEDSNHRLTGDATQRASMEAAGWGYEGVVMCAP
jgi:hypothetical protein